MSERAPFLRHALPGWTVARRHAVPPAMVERATARRTAGDWRGACAEARFDVHVDLADIRDRHGADLAGRVEDDLLHLVPDLVRWHLPREHSGGLGRVLPNLPVTLARYDGGPALWVRTPVHLERPLRPQLRFGALDPALDAVRTERWDGARYLWDARATDGLRHRLGDQRRAGIDDRVAFHHRDGRPLTADALPTSAPGPDDPVALLEWVLLLLDAERFDEAWTAAGVASDLTDGETSWWVLRRRLVQLNATVPALAAAARHLLATDPPATWTGTGRASFALRPTTWHTTLVVTARDGHAGPELTGALVSRETADSATVLPRVTWQRFPDLDLLRTGRLARDGLHPLVRSALFPDEKDTGRFATGATTAAPATVPVRCRGTWHRVGWRDGHVDPHDHAPDETRREQTMRSLGGVVPRCFTVTETWRAPTATRLPRRLRELRRDGLAMIVNGDTDAFVRLLDAGVDPAGIRDRRRRTPLHLAAHLDSADLVRRLVAAGLDVNGGDAVGRTPLCSVLFDGGSAPLVRALLDAGADPARTDDLGCSALHLLRSPDAATILPWLLDAGLGLEHADEYGRTPLMAQVIAMAPPGTVRAMLNAGADPRASDEYSDLSIAELIDPNSYDDLDFLRVAAGDGND
ncbi:ankyrin repeat domain-containing protein [Virgisporangium ochraceum]|uniref:Ankyrin n=1 Tax=Virgisporangium ochraceum TaxID=65505 RepID=A0A8J4E9D3_9ACTN|nr:ankyrin repeat domain-containing protein [Virgisporangium ochraceum]GIJ67120.1 hypothetical protein Voc01_020370 [Virgisporangium ochraceum]